MSPHSTKITVVFGPHSPNILSGAADFDPQDIYFGPLLRAFHAGLAEWVSVELATVAPEDYVTFARNSGSDAFLILSTEFLELPHLAALYDAGVKFVAIGASPDSRFAHIPSVDCENRGGGAAAARYLLDLGHKRLACVNLARDHMDQSDRMQGFLETLEAAGYPVQPELTLVHDEYRYDLFPIILDEWIDRLQLRNSLPTAVFTCDFNMAETLMSVLDARGIRIPGTISVLGFDDAPGAARLRPQLTTVRQPVAEMGARAAERLTAAVGRPGPVEGGLDVFPTEIVVRGSTASLIVLQ